MFDEKNAKRKNILKEIAEKTEIENLSRDSLEDTKRAMKNSDKEFL